MVIRMSEMSARPTTASSNSIYISVMIHEASEVMFRTTRGAYPGVTGPEVLVSIYMLLMTALVNSVV